MSSSESQLIRFYAGEDVTLPFAYTPEPGTSLAGWTIDWSLLTDEGGTVLFTSTANITDATNGLYNVSLNSSQTANLTPGLYYWESRRTDTGSHTVLATGWAQLLPTRTWS